MKETIVLPFEQQLVDNKDSKDTGPVDWQSIGPIKHQQLSNYIA